MVETKKATCGPREQSPRRNSNYGSEWQNTWRKQKKTTFGPQEQSPRRNLNYGSEWQSTWRTKKTFGPRDQSPRRSLNSGGKILVAHAPIFDKIAMTGRSPKSCFVVASEMHPLQGRYMKPSSFLIDATEFIFLHIRIL